MVLRLFRARRNRLSRRHSLPSEVSLVAKYILFALNILFWTLGLLMVLVGIYVKSQKIAVKFGSTLPWFLDPANLFIVVGSIVFVLPIFGCIGSLRENIALLKVFEYSINTLFVVELGCVIYICVDSSRVKRKVENFFYKAIPSYRDDPDLQDIIDWTQRTMECCGVKSHDDWEKNVYFSCHPANAMDNQSIAMVSEPWWNPDQCGVPFSCCKEQGGKKRQEIANTQCGNKIRHESYEGRYIFDVIHSAGCVDATIKFILHEDRVALLLAVAGSVVFLQLMASGLAQNLVYGINRQKARWERQNSIIEQNSIIIGMPQAESLL